MFYYSNRKPSKKLVPHQRVLLWHTDLEILGGLWWPLNFSLEKLLSVKSSVGRSVGAWKIKSERNVDNRGAACEVLEGSRHSASVACVIFEWRAAEVKLFLYWYNWHWSDGAEKSVVIKKRSAALKIINLGIFPQGWGTEVVARDFISCWQVMLPRWSWRRRGDNWGVTLWVRAGVPEDRPEEAITEGTTSVALEAPGSKVSWRKVEAWQNVAWAESLKRTLEKLWMKVEPSWRDPRTLEMSVTWMNSKDNSSHGTSLSLWGSVCCAGPLEPWSGASLGLWGRVCCAGPLELRRSPVTEIWQMSCTLLDFY